jgi:hypothetical protein
MNGIKFLILSAFIISLSSCATGSSGQPKWIHNPYNVYDRQANVAAVGSGNSRQEAERNAFGNLVVLFGQSIHIDETLYTSYREAVRSGVTANWSQSTSLDSTIMTSAGLDSLVGAEIGETWFDGNNTHYAVAVMNKAKATQIYSDMIRSNQGIIENLTNISSAQRGTMESFARYRFAATIADINVSYGNLLSVIGSARYAQGLKRGDEYRMEAAVIAREIPVSVTLLSGGNIEGSARVRDAFAKTLGEMGFATTTQNARYSLEINLSMTQESGSQNTFVRYNVSANLNDTRTRQALIPVYNFTGREGQLDLPRAITRAITITERTINSGDDRQTPAVPSFQEHLNSYFSQILGR